MALFQDSKKRDRSLTTSISIETTDKETYESLSYENVSESAEYLLKRTSHRPKIAVICGSGLGTRFFLHFL